MNTTAFFFQGEFLLLPEAVPDSNLDQEISLDLLKDFGEIELKTGPDAEDTSFGLLEIPAINAGCDTGKTISCVIVPPKALLPRGWRTVNIRFTLPVLAGGIAKDKDAETGASAFILKASVLRLFRAFHILQWRQESRFCGSCGARNTDSTIELARVCPSCGRLEFPRISPAVITLITNSENEVLLAHNKKFQAGVYSLIAGFNEPGESLEESVAREIKEEVNLDVKDIRYIASQPWPFPNSLMFGFRAAYAGGPIRVDNIEIDDAKWFSKENLPSLPRLGSVSRYLINRWTADTL